MSDNFCETLEATETDLNLWPSQFFNFRGDWRGVVTERLAPGLYRVAWKLTEHKARPGKRSRGKVASRKSQREAVARIVAEDKLAAVNAAYEIKEN